MKKKLEAQISLEEQDTGIATGKPFETLEKGKERKGRQTTASLEEQIERARTLRTMGRKGCKLPRITVAFTPDNFEYVQQASRFHGKSFTFFINSLIEADRKKNAGLFNDIQAIIAKHEQERGL